MSQRQWTSPEASSRPSARLDHRPPRNSRFLRASSIGCPLSPANLLDPEPSRSSAMQAHAGSGVIPTVTGDATNAPCVLRFRPIQCKSRGRQ